MRIQLRAEALFLLCNSNSNLRIHGRIDQFEAWLPDLDLQLVGMSKVLLWYQGKWRRGIRSLPIWYSMGACMNFLRLVYWDWVICWLDVLITSVFAKISPWLSSMGVLVPRRWHFPCFSTQICEVILYKVLCFAFESWYMLLNIFFMTQNGF